MTRKASSKRVAEPATQPAEYSIDDLARATGINVPTLRVYQDHGLIPPPERRGRIGVYGDIHLTRLRAIQRLLGRGYSQVSIRELIAAWEEGSGLGAVLGLEPAPASPWREDPPAWLSLTGLVQMFGGQFDPRWLSRATELGVLELDGSRFRVSSPRLLQAGAELVKLGIPFDELLEVLAVLRPNVTTACDRLAKLIERHLFDPHGKSVPPAGKTAELGAAIWRLGSLVETAAQAEVAHAMKHAATERLGERLALLLERFEASPPPG